VCLGLPDGRVRWTCEGLAGPQRALTPLNTAATPTPVLERRSGTNIVWVTGWYDVEGYDVHSGRTMGRFSWEWAAYHLAASPVLAGDRLVVPGAGRHVCLDLEKLVAGEPPVRWSQRSRGEISSSPVVAGGLAFLVAENGWAACLDPASGDRLWERRLPAGHFASVLAMGDRVYFPGEDGRTSVVRRGATFELLSENRLGELQFASFAPAGGRLLIRGVEHLYCIAESP